MLLRNYYNILAGSVVGCTDTTTFGDGHINLKNPYTNNLDTFGSTGTNTRLFPIASLYYHSSSTGGGTGSCIAFGTGATAVSYDDYVLASRITSNIGVSNISSGTSSYTNGKYSNTCSMVVTNTGASDITVNEIGLFLPVALSSGQSPKNYLVYREVLSTPFTIAAGESVNYTHNFEFTMPTIS